MPPRRDTGELTKRALRPKNPPVPDEPVMFNKEYRKQNDMDEYGGDLFMKLFHDKKGSIKPQTGGSRYSFMKRKMSVAENRKRGVPSA